MQVSSNRYDNYSLHRSLYICGLSKKRDSGQRRFEATSGSKRSLFFYKPMMLQNFSLNFEFLLSECFLDNDLSN